MVIRTDSLQQGIDCKEEKHMQTRRQFIKTSAALGGGLALAARFGIYSARAAANSSNLRKWIQPLRSLTALGDPNGIPVAAGVQDRAFANTTFYQITAGECLDQLHPDLPNPTRLWGYWDGSAGSPIQRHLGGVILARRGTASRVRFTNRLPPRHILPLDTSLMGANQAHNRMVAHAHGGLVPWICDGGPFGWGAPDGTPGLSFLNGPGSVLDNIPGLPILPGQADFFYPNDQSTRLLWYHDHAHGITRLNAYAGIASAYLILDAVNDAYVASGKVPGLASTVPLVFQDKVFVSSTTADTDPTWAEVAPADVQAPGSLWYEHGYDPKEVTLRKGSKYLTPPSLSCVPEFFGDTMLCNGTVYPVLTVEPKRYRFLILNACNARFLNINLFKANPNNVDGIDLDRKSLFPLNPAGPNMIQIGTEGGFLLQEVPHVSPKPYDPASLTGNLLLGPAERADVIIDFTGLAGQELILYNDATGPFPDGPETNDYYLGNPKNPRQPITVQDPLTGKTWSTGPDTRQILRIKVVAGAFDPQPPGPILNPNLLDPAPLVPYTTTVAPIPPLPRPAGVRVRDLTLNEDFDEYGRLRQVIGTTDSNGAGGFGLDYLAPVTEKVAAGSVEVWRIFNLTADTHPIHFHLVNVQVLSRQPFKLLGSDFRPAGLARGPEANELGWKETVQMHPGEVTTVIMKFDLAVAPFAVPPSPRTGGNEYVWHCHILEHEEHDMMRPLVVT